jgi:2-oxo-3-hexenedioate decarboxylase/2-keto-4-pentenoate hydratase
VNAQEIGALAERIAQHRRARIPMEFLGEATAGMSEEDGYKVQFAVHDLLTGGGQNQLAGWKVAFAVPAQYEPLKLSGPAFAGIYHDGVRKSGEVFQPGWPIKTGVECEMVARIAKDVTAGGAAFTAESIKPYVANLYCGMEVVENRYGDVSKLGGPGRIADDVLQAACIIGTEIKDWQKLDFANVKGRSEFEGKEIGAGPGSNVMGGALVSLAWLANKLIGHGKHLKAGDVVLTGSVHAPQFLPGPGKAKAEFVGLGGAEIIVK